MWDNLKEVCVYLMVHAPFSSYVMLRPDYWSLWTNITIHTLDICAKQDHEAVPVIINNKHRLIMLTPECIV